MRWPPDILKLLFLVVGIGLVFDPSSVDANDLSGDWTEVWTSKAVTVESRR